MARQTRFYVVANGIKLHYLERGRGNPVVLIIPGIISPAATWDFVARELALHAHVFVLDVRGRGLSEQRPGLSYKLDDYAGDAAGLIDELGLNSPLVLGHSMGARIGIRLAARWPTKVRRLILVDPPVSGPGRRAYPVPLQFYLDNLEAARRGTPTQPPPGWTDEQIRTRAEWLPTCSVDAVVATYRGFHEEDIHSDLPKIGCPARLVYAELGGTVNDDDADEIVSSIPGATKTRIADAGHLIPWDKL